MAFAQTQNLPAIQQLMAGYTLSDYRTLTRGTPSVNITTSKAFVLNYHDFNFSNLYTALANVSVSRDRNPYMYQSAITNSLSLFTSVPYAGSLQRYSASAEINRFFKGLNVNVQVDGSFSVADIASSPQNKVMTSRLIRSEWGVAGVSAFSQVFSMEAGSRFMHLRLLTNTADQSANSVQKSLFIKPRIILKIRPTQTTRLRLTHEWVHWKNDGNASNLLFLDGTFQWNPLQKSYSFELTGNNLLNTQQFIYTQFSGNYLVSQKQFLLQPRYVTVRAEWRF